MAAAAAAVYGTSSVLFCFITVKIEIIKSYLILLQRACNISDDKRAMAVQTTKDIHLKKEEIKIVPQI